MQPSAWLTRLRAALEASRRSRGAPPKRSRAAGRRALFEPLEDRLVFALQVGITPDLISENGGVAAATVTRTGSLALPLTVNLSSSDTSEAAVPGTVVIGANQNSATFNVTAVNDGVLDATATVTITVSATGHGVATDTVGVLNDDFVALRPGAVSDVVNVFPNAQPGGFDAALGPAGPLGTTAGDPMLPIIDLSTVASGDQRHQLNLLAGTGYASAASLVKVNVNERYTISARGYNALEIHESPIGFASFDVDKNEILPLHVSKHAFAADTTLAATLSPGATSILVTNASGWSNDVTQPAESRSLAWYGYTDSTGHTYAEYTYTRNVAFDLDTGLWEPGAIYYDAAAGAYRIPLLKPWSGPTIAAGSAIRNATSGPMFNQPPVASQHDGALQDWSEYSASFGGGVWQNGQRSEEGFRPGTVYIQPVFAAVTTWDDSVIGPAEDSIYGGPADPTRRPLEPTASQQVSLDFDVLAKGALGGAANVVIESVAAPRHGAAMIVPNAGPGGRAVISYRSAAWFVGTDVVKYTLRNTATNETVTLSATVHVLGSNYQQNAALAATLASQAQIVEGNAVPTARDFNAYAIAPGQTLAADGARAVGVLAYASDPTDTLVVRLLSGPTSGALNLNYDGTFTYTPAAGFVGLDTFRYEVFDGLHSASAVASIRVLNSADDLLQQRLKDLGLGMLNYESARNRFPLVGTAEHFNASGNPHLSWRVHLLPYIGYKSLYDQFRLNEPWNSVHNSPLASKMPDIFRNPSDAASVTTTRFQTISGEGAPYYWRRSSGLLVGPRSSEFTDGLQHSILIVESGANLAVTWTKPDDLEFITNAPLAALGTITSGRINAVMADGRTITLPSSIDPATFKALVTISGGEVVDADTLRREFAEANNTLLSFGEAASDGYFKNIVLGMLNYADSRGALPVHGSAPLYDANNVPKLSWRVHLLPFMGYSNLFSKFKLDESWDSPTNFPLLAEMPDIFRSAGDASGSTTTRVMTFWGDDTPFKPGTRGTTYPSFGDGTSNTISFMEAGPNVAVPWTKPQDIPFDANNPLPALGNLPAGTFRAAFADGSVRKLPSNISTATLAALATLRAPNSGDGLLGVRDEELRGASGLAARELARTGRVETQMRQQNNFKQIALAMHNYVSSRGRFPASHYSTAGQPLLSWRVLILPYIDQGALYSQFRLNEPWDSPHNLSLLKFMPDVFRTPGDPADSVTTRVTTFTGPGAPFPTGGAGVLGPQFATIQDGTSKTIMLAEAGDGHDVPWTKPVDTPFNPNNPFSALGDFGPQLMAAFFDGSVRPQRAPMTISQLDALITHQGDEDPSNPPEVPNVPAFYVHQTAGDTTTNEFGVDSFDVVLDRAPQSNVVLGLNVSDASVAALGASTVTFTPSNWNVPQRVALRGVDNFLVNGDRTVNVTVSVVDNLSDDGYDPLANQVFSATIRDDDRPAGDFNGDLRVDGTDFLEWQRSLGQTRSAAKTQGDANSDGDVDRHDLNAWRTQFGDAAVHELAADFTGDGRTNSGDLTVWISGFGTPAGATSASGDADSDGDVDGSDFLVWQRTLGAGMPAAATVVSKSQSFATALPQPLVLTDSSNLFKQFERSDDEYLAEQAAMATAAATDLTRDQAFDWLDDSSTLNDDLLSDDVARALVEESSDDDHSIEAAIWRRLDGTAY